MQALKDILLVAVSLAILMMGFLLWKKTGDEPVIEIQVDTVIIRDTIDLPVPEPETIYVHHFDTLVVTIGDTIEIPVQIPIERKVYATEDYRAEIEGFRPKLISMTVYPEKIYINTTTTKTVIKNRRFGVGLSAGYAITPHKATPYIGVGVNYNIISF